MIFKITTSIIILLLLLTFGTCLLYFSISQPLYKSDFNIFNKTTLEYTSKKSYLFHNEFISVSEDIPIQNSNNNLYSAFFYYYDTNSTVYSILNFCYKLIITALVSKVVPIFFLIAYMNHVGKRFLNNDFNKINNDDIENNNNNNNNYYNNNNNNNNNILNNDNDEQNKKNNYYDDIEQQLAEYQYNNYNDYEKQFKKNQKKKLQQKEQLKKFQQEKLKKQIEKSNNKNKNNNNNNNIENNSNNNNIILYKVKKSNSTWLAVLILLFNMFPFIFISLAIFYPLGLTKGFKDEPFIKTLCIYNDTNQYYGLCSSFSGFDNIPKDDTIIEYVWRPTLAWYSLVVALLMEAGTICITIKSLIMDTRNNSFKTVLFNFINLDKKDLQLESPPISPQQQATTQTPQPIQTILSQPPPPQPVQTILPPLQQQSPILQNVNSTINHHNINIEIMTPEATPETTPNLTSQLLNPQPISSSEKSINDK